MTARHTRQGLARGQRHGTLDREDLDLGSPGPWTWSADRQGRPPARAADDARLPLIAPPGCWCGREVGHDWPGRDGGAPHPNPATEVQEALARWRRRVDDQVLAALEAARPDGLVVLVDRLGFPTRYTPASGVPEGEVRVLRDPDPRADGGPWT